ncbi:MFS transporter [Actinocorallia sp. API 0066]|uniref:MFS transporter n=1 Tax=Actinocorallia sp. API 0066 TaxID=2896846 RepID=UPI0027147BA4|nr:MFS transporter [Actinocorallia sp. API 0066]
MGIGLMSSTIVSVALPQIVGSLGGSQAQYTWVVTATLLTMTASTPIWGRLADLFNQKMLLQVGIVMFVIASLACGFAQNTGQLIAFRAVQGVGAGALQVLVQVIIAAMIAPKERGKYNGYLGGVMAFATVGGPLLGGVLADSPLGWRWCFFIAVPFLLIASVILHRFLHVATVRAENVKIDYWGAGLIAAGVSLLLVWVTFAGDSYPWWSWETAAMVGGSITLLGLATVVELRHPQPVVPVHIVRQRTPLLAIIASLAVGMAMFGGSVFLGQYFQIGRGYSPTEAGLLTIPMMLGVLVAATVSGRIISRTGTVRPHIIAGLVVLIAGFAAMSVIDHETSLYYIGFAMALIGIGVGASLQNLVLVVQNSVSLQDMGAASGAVTFFRSLGGTIGVSVLGAILATRVTDLIKEGFAKIGVTPSGSRGGNLDIAALPAPLQEIVRFAYGDATGHIFLVSLGVAVVGLVAAVFLKPPALRESLDLHAAEPVEGDAAAEPLVAGPAETTITDLTGGHAEPEPVLAGAVRADVSAHRDSAEAPTEGFAVVTTGPNALLSTGPQAVLTVGETTDGMPVVRGRDGHAEPKHVAAKVTRGPRHLTPGGRRERITGNALLVVGALAVVGLVAGAVTVRGDNGQVDVARDNIRVAQEAQAADRYTRAVRQLGSAKTEIRTGAVYALERVAADAPRERPAVRGVLAAFVREHDPAPDLPLPATPAPDVAVALRVLAEQPRAAGEHLDLSAIRVRGGDLSGADLRGATLAGADLRRVNLAGADLEGADLRGARLRNTDLTDTNLSGADLRGAHGVTLESLQTMTTRLDGTALDPAPTTG